MTLPDLPAENVYIRVNLLISPSSFRLGLLHCNRGYPGRDIRVNISEDFHRASSCICCVFLPCARILGALIGTSVTGSLNFDGNPANFFDPANGFVPARFENAAGPTVTIDDFAPEFGFNDGANRDIANFTDGRLVIRDRATGGGSQKITLTFTDDAFAGISLVSSNFRKPIQYDIVGDE